MIGSEKQIQWASDLISDMRERNDAKLAQEEMWFESKPSTYASMIEVRRSIHAIIDGELIALMGTGNAGQIINSGVPVRQIVLNHYDELREQHKAWIDRTSKDIFINWAINF